MLRPILLSTQLMLSSFALASSALSTNQTFPRLASYSPPSFDETQIDEFLMLGASGPQLRRRDKCKDNYDSCESIGRGDACCPDHTVCTHDENGNLACCPDNAVCTGALPSMLRDRSMNDWYANRRIANMFLVQLSLFLLQPCLMRRIHFITSQRAIPIQAHASRRIPTAINNTHDAL